MPSQDLVWDDGTVYPRVFGRLYASPMTDEETVRYWRLLIDALVDELAEATPEHLDSVQPELDRLRSLLAQESCSRLLH